MQITVADLEGVGPYWWTTPDLKDNGDPTGAIFIDGRGEKAVFRDEEYFARRHAEEAEVEAAHWRTKEREARQR